MRLRLSGRAHRRFHGTLTVVWLVMVPVSILTGWIESVVFIAAISIYANFAAHFAALEAANDGD